MAVSFFLQIRSAAGQRRHLPSRQFASIAWNEIRYGGFADFTLETTAQFTELTDIVPTDIVEVYVGDAPQTRTLRYRGYVSSRRRREAEPGLLTLTGYGRAVQAGQHVAKKRYITYGGRDVADLFRDVAREWVTPREQLPLAVRTSQVGAKREQLDAYVRPVKEIFNDLAEQAGNLAVWGCDVITDPQDPETSADRLYMRPISAGADHTLPAPSRRISNGDTEENVQDVVNVLELIGGQPTYPNLLYNASFERPVFAGNGVGNLLTDPGFEGRDGAWHLGGGASFKSTGKSEGPTYSGDDMVELDNGGEYFEQTISTGIAAGHDITFGGHARREAGAYAAAATMTLTFLRADNSVTGTPAAQTVAPADALYAYYFLTARAPDDAAKCRIHVECTQAGGSGKGMVWDDMEVYDASSARQDRWTLVVKGTPGTRVVSQNWLCADAYHGGYSLLLDQISSDRDGHDIHLTQSDNGRFDVSGNQQIRFGVAVKAAPGTTQAPLLRLDVQAYRADGSTTGSAQRTYINQSGGQTQPLPAAWTYYFLSCTVPSDAVKARADVVFRGSGQALLDALCVRDENAATWDPARPEAFFIPDGPLQLTLRAQELMPTGSPERGSAQTYGERAIVDSQDSLTNRADAEAYARAVFAARALPPLAPTVDLVDDSRVFRCGQRALLVGADGPLLRGGAPAGALPIVKVAHRYDGLYTVTLSLSREKPDFGQQVLDEIRKRLARGQMNAGGPTSNSQGTLGGVGAGGFGGFWGTEPRAEDDPTLHDDWRQGPHIADAERASWAGTTQEVEAARADTVHNVGYPSLAGIVNAALQNADTAQSTASAAQSTASAAQNAANTAQNTATSAQNAAGAAQSTANTALGAANTAQSAAQGAQSSANAAQSAANNAQGTANAAQSAAGAAQAEITAARKRTAKNTTLGSLEARLDAMEADIAVPPPQATNAALGVVRGGGQGNCTINADGSIQAPAAGGSGGLPIVSVDSAATASYDVPAGTGFVLVDTNTRSVQVNLPAISVASVPLVVRNLAGNGVSVRAASGDHIDGLNLTRSLGADDCAWFVPQAGSGKWWTVHIA